MQIYPVFIPQMGCPFECIYCNQQQFSSVKELPFEILRKQIAQFCSKHKHTDKQIAFFGGTFTGLSITDREYYYNLTNPFLDDKTSLRISTRPDFISSSELDWCKDHNVKTIELGIQDFTDEVLHASRRGYDKAAAIEACKRVKNYGFELVVQLMPGLPGSSHESNRECKNTLLRILPDSIRLYPLIILFGTQLWTEWATGKFQPLSLEEAIDICADYCLFAEEQKIDVIKIGIPPLDKNTKYVGPYHPAFGELVRGEILIRKIVSEYVTGNSVFVSPKEISLFTGHNRFSTKRVLDRLGLSYLNLKSDSSIAKGEIRLSLDCNVMEC